MSIETEGALNRLTAAVLALAIEQRKDDTVTSYTQAEDDIRYSFNRQLQFILRSDNDD